jgi:type II secretory pathway component GspD/PulD (secretin)
MKPCLLLALLLASAGCQAFEPTLPQRMRAPSDRDAMRSPVAESAPAREWAPPVPAIADPVTLAPRATLGCEEVVQLELRGVTLAEALHTLGEYARVNLLLDASLDQVVDVSFPSIRVDQALEVLLERHGLRLVESRAGVFTIVREDGNQFAERRFLLHSARVADVEANLKVLAGSGAQIVLDTEQNFVHVRGSQAEIDAIERYLDLADRVRLQVLVEMHIAEVRLDTNFELGIDLALSNLDLGEGALDLAQALRTGSRQFTLDYDDYGGEISGALNALQSYVGLDLLSSPRVVAVNNTQSAIEIVREVPYVRTTTETTVGGTGAGTSTQQQVEFKEVGLKLKVKPIIRQGGVIELELEQELSEVAQFLLGVPAVDRRKLTSRLEVEDRKTLVIGGLMQDRSTETDTGVPGLVDLPFLGRLFRSDQDQGQKRELLLFLTPTILAPGEEEGVSETWRQVFDERRDALGLGANEEGG